MVCPKCSEGFLRKVIIRTVGMEAFVCELCSAVWFMDEPLQSGVTHTLRLFTHDIDRDYSVGELNEDDIHESPIFVGIEV